jgi:tetratricopeptide (TPR) repeat protein
MLAVAYPLPSKEAYDLAPSDSQEPLGRLTNQLRNAIGHGDDWSTAAKEFLSIERPTGWLSGLIHRACVDGDDASVDALSTLRFFLLRCAEDDASAVHEPTSVSESAWRMENLLEHLGKAVLEKRITSLGAAREIQARLDRPAIEAHLNRTLVRGEPQAANFEADLFACFIALLLCERFYSSPGVMTSAFHGAFSAHRSGFDGTAFSLLRVAYVLAAESGDAAAVLHALQNMLTVTPVNAGLESILQFAEIYNGPPWTNEREVMLACAESLAHLIAHLPSWEIDNRELARLLAPQLSEIFFHRAAYLSLEEYAVKGLHTEAERLLDFMAELADQMDTDEGRSLTWFYRGSLEKLRGRHALARELYEKTFRQIEHGDPNKAFTALDALTRIEIEMGAIDSAKQHHVQCLRLAGDDPPPEVRASCLSMGGLLEMAQERYADALVYFQQAQELFDELPREAWHLMAESNQGNVLKCLAVLGREMPIRSPAATDAKSLLTQGHMLTAQAQASGDPAASAKLLEEAAEKFRAIGNGELESTALFHAAKAWIRERAWERAAHCLARTQLLCETHGHPPKVSKEDLDAAIHFVESSLEPGVAPAVDTPADDEAVRELFAYLLQKALIGNLTDAEISSVVKERIRAGSLAVSFAMNVPLQVDKKLAKIHADLAFRIVRLSGLQEPMIQRAVALSLSEIGRDEDAREVLRSVPRDSSETLDEKLGASSMFLLAAGSLDLMPAESVAREAVASPNSAHQIEGYILAGRVARARGNVQEAIGNLESAWELSSHTAGDTASKASQAAYQLAQLYLYELENPSAAALWLERSRKPELPDSPRPIQFMEASIDLLRGRLVDAEAKFRDYKADREARHDDEGALHAEINLIIIAIARKTLRGDRARARIRDLRRRAEEAGMREQVIYCAKLLGDLATIEGHEAEALDAYTQVAEAGDAVRRPVAEAVRLMRIQAIDDASERLTECLLTLDEWSEDPSTLRYQPKVWITAAELLNRDIRPGSRAEHILRELTPPIPMFNAAFECCRRAENLARDLQLDDDLPNILRVMGLSLAKTADYGMVSGILLEARRLGEEQLARAVDASLRNHWRDFIGQMDAWVLTFADLTGRSQDVFAVFETIRERDDQFHTRRGWLSLEKAKENPDVLALEALAIEIESLARLIALGSHSTDLLDRYRGMLEEYYALWARAEQAMQQTTTVLSAQELPPVPSGLAIVEIVAAFDRAFVLVTTDKGRRHFRVDWRLELIQYWQDSLSDGLRNYTVGPWLLQCGASLWKSIESVCGSAEVLGISTNEPLRGIPLHVALAHASGKAVFYVANARNVLEQLSGESPPLQKLASFIDPDGDLPGSHLEAVALKPLFAEPTIRHGAAADWETFTRLAPSADVLHLACHGEYIPSDPIQSGLRLGKGTRIEGPQLAFHMKLPAHLVLLTACHSGTTREVEGGSAISWLFLKAGARCVLGALWPIPDLATAILIPRFCSLLLNGQRPAAALEQAASELRDMPVRQIAAYIGSAQISAEVRAQLSSATELAAEADELPFADPYFWAGFMIIGDGWSRSNPMGE